MRGFVPGREGDEERVVAAVPGCSLRLTPVERSAVEMMHTCAVPVLAAIAISGRGRCASDRRWRRPRSETPHMPRNRLEVVRVDAERGPGRDRHLDAAHRLTRRGTTMRMDRTREGHRELERRGQREARPIRK